MSLKIPPGVVIVGGMTAETVVQQHLSECGKQGLDLAVLCIGQELSYASTTTNRVLVAAAMMRWIGSLSPDLRQAAARLAAQSALREQKGPPRGTLH